MDSHGGDDDDDDAGWGKLLTRSLELSGNPTSRDIWKRVGGMYEGENFACQYLRYVNGFLTCRKILRHGVIGFISHPKVGVLRIFTALKNPSPRPGLNPRHLVQWQAH
jgi:hypothetical protein